MHVFLELANTLGREGVRDGLPLAGMLCSVSGVEKSSLDGHERIVEFPLADS